MRQEEKCWRLYGAVSSIERGMAGAADARGSVLRR